MRFSSLCIALLLVLAPAVFGLQEDDAINKGSRSRLVSKLKREVVTAKSGNAAPFRHHSLQLKRGEKASNEEKLLMPVERGQGDEKSDEKEVRALLASKKDKADKAFEEAEMGWTDEEEEEETNEFEEDRLAKDEDEDDWEDEDEDEDEDDWEDEDKDEDEDDWEDEDEDEDEDDWEVDNDDGDVAPAILEGESADGIIIVEADDMESLAKALKEAGATDEDIEEIMEEEAAFEELEEELEAEFGGVDEAKAEAAGWEAGTVIAEKAMKQKGAGSEADEDVSDEKDEDEDMLDEEEDILDQEDEDMLDEDEDMLDEDEDMLDEEDGKLLDEDEDEEAVAASSKGAVTAEESISLEAASASVGGGHEEKMLDEEDGKLLDEDEDEDEEAVAASSKGAVTAEESISLEAASASVGGGHEEKSSSSSSRAGFIWALSGICGLMVLVAAVWKTAARHSSSDLYSMPNTTAFGSDASSQEQPFGLDAEASLTQHYGQYRRVTAHGQESR